jgi:hypothetical protein
MQNLLGLEQFWELLDSRDVFALSQVCRLARDYAFQHHCNILVLGIFGKKISSHLNTKQYTCFRCAFELVYDLFPKNKTITLLQQQRTRIINYSGVGFFRYYRSNQLRQFKNAARKVLALEAEFVHYRPFRLSLPPGSHCIDEFYSPDRNCKALVGVTFNIPAYQNLSASITIGVQTLCQYGLIRDSSQRTIEDSPLFNQPLIINHERFGGFPLIIESDCPLELHMTHMRFVGDDFWDNVSNMDDYPPPLDPNCLTYLVRSPYKANDNTSFFCVGSEEGLAGWI